MVAASTARGGDTPPAGEGLGAGATPLLVGIPTGFAAPANVAPARRLAAALAAAAIFCAVTEAGGDAGCAALGATDAGAADLAAVDVFALELVVAPGLEPVRGVSVPGPLVPSMRAGAPGSEAPSSTSGSSNSPDAKFDESNVGIRSVSGRVSDTGAVMGASEGSSNAPCASKSSSDSCEALFAVTEDGAAAIMGSSTGRSARGSSLGREAASILNVSCSAIAEVPRRWLTDRRRPNPHCAACHTLRRVPVQSTGQKP